MRCTNKGAGDKIKYRERKGFISVICLSVLLMSSLSGCGRLAYTMPYSVDSAVSGFNVVSGQNTGRVDPFAAELCVVTNNIMDDDAVDMSRAGAAALFDLNNREVLYSKNAHERFQPASLTKVMTALVALQNASPDKVLTATNVVNITETGAQLCGLKSGDTMTLDQALHILLMYSANDVAMMIAENVGGTTEHFMEMMNEEAKRLGATNTNFMNPHGLTQEGHYTTAYDLYLIFNEAIQYETFNEIIQMTSYQTTYYNSRGESKELSVKNTNRFLKGDFKAPENITVIGGKTGTTNAAGHCLMLLSRDTGGSPYISVILRSEANDILYPEMIDLLDEINK